MNHLKISTRLLLLIGVMSAIVLMVGGLGLWALAQTNESLRTVYEDRTVPAVQLGEIKAALLTDRSSVAAAVLEPKPEVLEEHLGRLEASAALVQKDWKAYMATYLTPREAELARQFAALLAQIDREATAPAIAALRARDTVAAGQLATGRMKDLFHQAEPVLDELLKLQVDVASAEYAQALQRATLLRALGIAGIVVGISGGALFGLWLARGIVRELGAEPGEAAALARSVAAGDLSVPIALRAGDRGSLMAQLATMRDSLARVVTDVRRSAESVATASSEIAQGNNDLSGRTEEQASALQQTAASMEQLNTTVMQNAENARQASRLAQGASGVAARGGEVVTQVVGAMKAIDASSKRIADIIGVIDGIAFQTNILALNAAVEAARAGDQGRGFAVVAGEVRALAQRSAEAAREIKGLIGSSVERVEQGSVLADRAGETMQEVVVAIRRVTDLMAAISAATGEQSAGVEQVGHAVTQMDQATQQNAALVEQSAAAADSLSQQARQLVQAVSVFRLAEA